MSLKTRSCSMLLALALGSCASSRTTEPASAAPAPQGSPSGVASSANPDKRLGAVDVVCPVLVPGTRVATTEVPNGVTVLFTTVSGDVGDLRRRVRLMTSLHNQDLVTRYKSAQAANPSQTAPAASGAASANPTMPGEMMLPDANAEAQDIAGGAAVTFRANQPAQLDDLRQLLRIQTERMNAGICPLLPPNPDAIDAAAG